MPALTNIQMEQYAQNIIKGMSQAEAYRDVYPKAKKWTDKTVYNRASEMRSIPEVDERIKELQAEAASAAVMDRQERMEILSSAELLQKGYPSEGLFIAGIASDYDEALELVRQITQETIETNMGTDVCGYIHYREQEK